MKLNLKTNPSNYFRLLLDILSAFKPFNGMTKREKDVFAELLHYNYLYKDIPYNDRMILVFGVSSKTRIMDYLSLSLSSMDSTLTRLRDKKFIERGINKIGKQYLFPYLGNININFMEDEDKRI